MDEVIERWRKAAPDLTIVCKDGEVKAIRAVLATASSTFDTMLNGPFIESNRNMIKMPDDKSNIVKAAIMYIQYGDLPENEPEEVILFLDKYGVNMSALNTMIIEHIKDPNNALRIYGKLGNPKLDVLRKDLVSSIIIGGMNGHAVTCVACGKHVPWKCFECPENKICAHAIDYKKRKIHLLKMHPASESIFKKIKLNKPDPKLVGRAFLEYFNA